MREGWTFHGGIIKINRIIFDGFPIDSISKKDSSFGQTVFSGTSRSDFSAALSKAPEFRYEIPKESL